MRLLYMMLALLLAPATQAAGPEFVQDPGGRLSKEMRAGLERILSEHHQLTTEAIIVSVPAFPDKVSAEAVTKILDKTKENLPFGHKVVVVQLAGTGDVARIEAEFALDTQLPREKLDELTSEVEAALGKEARGPGALLATRKILQWLDSPLVENEKLEELLANTPAPATAETQDGLSPWTQAFGFLLLALLIFAGQALLNGAEILYGREGAYKMNPFSQSWAEIQTKARELLRRNTARSTPTNLGGTYGEWQ